MPFLECPQCNEVDITYDGFTSVEVHNRRILKYIENGGSIENTCVCNLDAGG